MTSNVLQRMPSSNFISCISQYIKCGNYGGALALYQMLRQTGSLDNNLHLFTSLLKICAQLKDLDRGFDIHAYSIGVGIPETNIFIGSALVDMYAKCGYLVRAQQIFNTLPTQDVVVWTALMRGYLEHGYGEKARRCFEEMKQNGIIPNDVTFVCGLKACGNTGDMVQGLEIHSEIERRGLLENNPFLCSSLVDIYTDACLIQKAQEVFDRVQVRNVASWNAVISAYAERDQSEKSIRFFLQMQQEGTLPNSVTFVSSLKACGRNSARCRGQELHAIIVSLGLLESEIVLGGSLVDMYIKCGLLNQAENVFDKLSHRNVVSWTTLLSGFVDHGRGGDALRCFGAMQNEGISPNSVTFICVLKACGIEGDINEGREVHAEIERRGFSKQDRMLCNVLVGMYVKCGFLTQAEETFDVIPVRDVASWTTLITGYIDQGFDQDALTCFEDMQLQGYHPSFITFICALKACGNIGDIDKGREIHSEIEREGLPEIENLLGNSLVDMYAKCGSLNVAREIFENLTQRTIVSWTALITGYAEYGQARESLNCFYEMQLRGTSPDPGTFFWSLKACCDLGDLHTGSKIHTEIEKRGLLKEDLILGNALIEMYAKCGSLVLAQQVFDKLPFRDIATWTILIAGYNEHGFSEEALKCFQQFQSQGALANSVLFACSLKACGSINAIDKVGEIHAEVERMGIIHTDHLVGNILVDMYAKSGSITKAQEVFASLPVQDKISWTSLMVGYAQLGVSENVFHIFDRMLREGLTPDPVSFLVVLNTCSQTGLLDKSQTFLEAMIKLYGLSPTVEHQTCLVDLLGRMGQLDKAVSMAKASLSASNLVTWHTVLSACKNWGNLELGMNAFANAVYNDKQGI